MYQLIETFELRMPLRGIPERDSNVSVDPLGRGLGPTAAASGTDLGRARLRRLDHANEHTGPRRFVIT